MMTRKHYNQIAETIAGMPRSDLDDIARNKLVARLSLMLASDNPRFDYVKFATACKPDEPPKRPSHCTRKRVKPFMDDCGCEYCNWLDDHIMESMGASEP